MQAPSAASLSIGRTRPPWEYLSKGRRVDCLQCSKCRV
jgi:hypothetical protein